MPELPEVETIRLQLEGKILGKHIKGVSRSKKSLREAFSCSSAKVKNKEISGLSRWGKRLFIHVGPDGECFDISLGMTGSFRVDEALAHKIKHDHVGIEFQDGSRLVFNDPRRFGWVEFKRQKPELKGWDPILSSKKDFQWVVKKTIKTEVNAYTFLMDQKYIVGLGNIYVQEILFKAGVSPFRKIKKCSKSDLEKIRKHTEVILKKSLKSG